MVKLSKEYWKDVTCMALQDYIKYKRNEIIRNNGLYDALEEAEIIPFDNKIEGIMSNLISQSKGHERDLRVVARRIKCKFVEKAKR